MKPRASYSHGNEVKNPQEGLGSGGISPSVEEMIERCKSSHKYKIHLFLFMAGELGKMSFKGPF